MNVMSASRLGVAVLTAATIAGCGGSAPAASRQPTIPVETARAARISAPVEVRASGVVEPLQSVAVEAQVGGLLQDVNFKEGDPVTKGQVLFQINPRPFQAALRQAQATLARDNAQYLNAQRDADRYKTLVAKDYVTKSQADQTDATAASLRATLVSDSSAVEGARIMLGYTTIVAPISGRTGSLLLKQGNLVKAAGTTLVVINQLQPILVRFPVPQRAFEQLRRRAGQGTVPVTAAGSDSVQIADVGTLSFLDNAVDSLTGTVTAKAQFGNAGNQLWPGEYVHLTVQLEVQPNVVAVPTPAIVAGQSSPYVFVVGPENAVSIRTVAIGREVGDLTVIDSGLVGGEQVVTDGQSRLSPGSTVDIKTIPHPKPADAAIGDSSAGGRPGPAKKPVSQSAKPK
jgi:multidrug efflux system membrane fusion protein